MPSENEFVSVVDLGIVVWVAVEVKVVSREGMFQGTYLLVVVNLQFCMLLGC